MSTFGITTETSDTDKVGALNYALNNIGQGWQVDIIRGVFTPPQGPNIPHQLVYRYALFVFATDQFGTNISTDPQGCTWLGFKSFDIPTGVTFIGLPPLKWQEYYWVPIDTGSVPAGQSLYYRFNAPYAVPQFQFSSSGTVNTGYTEWVTNLANQVADSFDYVSDSTLAVFNTDLLPFTQNYQVAIGLEPIVADAPWSVSFPANLTWVNSTVTNTSRLESENYLTTGTLTLIEHSSQPSYYTTGTMATADRVNWDPAGLGINTAYPVFYDGTQWQAMFRPPIYGSFSSTSTFTVTTATNSYVFTYNHTDFQQGIEIVSTATSRIQLDGAGIYDLQFSVQCSNSAAGLHNAYIWLRQNGQDVVRSAGDITIPGKHGSVNGSTIASWNYYIETTATNEYVELVYGAEDIAVSFPTYAAGTGPTRPQSPAIIVTVEKVS